MYDKIDDKNIENLAMMHLKKKTKCGISLPIIPKISKFKLSFFV